MASKPFASILVFDLFSGRLSVLNNAGRRFRAMAVVIKENNEMITRREESDDRTVPEGRRKAVPTSTSTRGGKAITASKVTSQSPLFSETADSPRGAVPGKGWGRSRLPAQQAVPKSENAYSMDSSAMTMEEVANDGNLRRAF